MIYFDNAATTYPKPKKVIEAVTKTLESFSANPGRSSYKMAAQADEIVFEARQRAADCFGASYENVIFTKNCTEALNMAIKGMILRANAVAKPHVITTDLEHNSVLRPLERLSGQGLCEYTVVKVRESDEETLNAVFDAVKRNTYLIVMTGASNAFGTILPVKEVGKRAKQKGIYFIVDCAQTAGSIPVSLQDYSADILCMPGHKGLFGPMGTGLMVLRSGVFPETIVEGGTGSYSSLLKVPKINPDRYEAGTLNLPGIAGLKEGLNFAFSSMDEAYKKEMRLTRKIYEHLLSKGAVIKSPYPEDFKTMPLISFTFKGKDSSYLGELMSAEDIAVRTGFHCAYLAHKHHSTTDTGTVRLSLSRMNTEKDVEDFMYRFKKVLNNL